MGYLDKNGKYLPIKTGIKIDTEVGDINEADFAAIRALGAAEEIEAQEAFRQQILRQEAIRDDF